LHGHARDDHKLITCHLGNGCSIAAVQGGKSVDTSMGFTPLEGLLMGTRSGDVDPGAVLYLMTKEGMTPEQMDDFLNRQCGLYGLSTASNDMRELLELSRGGHAAARLAVETFCYRAKKYIGAYYAALNGCDAVIFTGGIGENAPSIRADICGPLDALGIRIDPDRNARAVGIEMNIAAEDSRVEVWVVPTDEGLVIARDTVRCLAEAVTTRQPGGESS
jgi:acetate kinase